jgi:excisionase family DNA binding protein
MSKMLLRVPAVAQRIDASKPRVWMLIRMGLLPAVRIGRQVRVDEEALEAWIKRGGCRLPGEGDGWSQ